MHGAYNSQLSRYVDVTNSCFLQMILVVDIMYHPTDIKVICQRQRMAFDVNHGLQSTRITTDLMKTVIFPRMVRSKKLVTTAEILAMKERFGALPWILMLFGNTVILDHVSLSGCKASNYSRADRNKYLCFPMHHLKVRIHYWCYLGNIMLFLAHRIRISDILSGHRKSYFTHLIFPRLLRDGCTLVVLELAT